MKKPYYLIITSFFPTPDSWRGPFVYDQVKALMAQGDYEVIVFKPRYVWSGKEDYEIDGVKVHYFGILPMPSYFFDGLTDGIGAYCFEQEVRRIGIGWQDVAVIHAHTVNAAAYGLAAKKHNRNIRVVVQHHSLDPFMVLNGKMAGWWINARFRARHALCIFNRVDLHLCISHAVEESLLAFPAARKEECYRPYLDRMQVLRGLKPIAPKRLYVLHNGVDTTIFHPLDNGKRNDDYFRIGCIANFLELKDYPTLLRAFDRLVKSGHKNYRLAIIGSGTAKQACLDYIRDNDLSDYVEWHPETRRQKLASFYQSLDLFVLPSLFEGFGCVYTEAYSCGVPFVACRNQGAAELIVEQELGQWTIQPGDDTRLAQIIEDYDRGRMDQHLKCEIDLPTLIEKYVAFLSSEVVD